MDLTDGILMEVLGSCTICQGDLEAAEKGFLSILGMHPNQDGGSDQSSALLSGVPFL